MEALRGLGLTEDPEFKPPLDRLRWPALKMKLSQLIRTRTREQWSCEFERRDACFSPVLSLDEAASNPHNCARETFVEVDGTLQPAPAPRFARSETVIPRTPRLNYQDEEQVLLELGYDPAGIRRLRDVGALRARS